VLVFEEGSHCFTQSIYNLENGYSDRNLKIVVGSLGIGIKTPFYEHGGLDRKTVSQFLRPYIPSSFRGTVKRNTFSGSDIHVWLETCDGGVYDIVDPLWLNVAFVRGLDLHVDLRQILENKDKDDLRKIGLHYYPAPEALQLEIIKAMKTRYGHKLELINVLRNS